VSKLIQERCRPWHQPPSHKRVDNLLVFQRPPQALDKDIVHAPNFAVHADGYLGVQQDRVKASLVNWASWSAAGPYGLRGPGPHHWIVLIGTPRRERRRVDPLSAPYSADLNPIEQAFAKLKAILRKAAARTKNELWNTIRRALDQCDADEFEGYLRHYGYGST
jgi:hypothetical protein